MYLPCIRLDADGPIDAEWGLRMDAEKRQLQHEVANLEQQKLALAGFVERAAEQIDDLADENCSEDAVMKARIQANRLRRIGRGARAKPPAFG